MLARDACERVGGGRARDATEEIQRGCHLIYFSIIKDIKPAARGPTLSVFFFLFSFLFAGLAGATRLASLALSLSPLAPSVFPSFFPAAGDGDKSEKKIQTASMVGRRDAIFRLPGDKNLINGRVVLKFKKGAAFSLARTPPSKNFHGE